MSTFSRDEYQDTLHLINRMKVAELKDLCRSMGLRVLGLKKDLITRLEDHLSQARTEDNNAKLLTIRTLVLKRLQGENLPNFMDLYNAISLGAFAVPVAPKPVSRESRYGELHFRRNPFQLLKRVIHGSPQYCPPVNNVRQVATLSFSFNDEEQRLFESGDPIRVMLYCGQPRTGDAIVQFPQPLDIQVNGTFIGQNHRGIKNKLGTAKPADITSLLKKKGLNTVQLGYTNADTAYLLYAYFVQILPTTVELAAITKKPPILKSSTLALMADDGSDIVQTSINITLRDPLSYTRMKYPARSILCGHIQCFDAHIWLESQLQLPSWTCPVCHNMIKLENVTICEFFKEILQKVPESVDSVQIDMDGGWEIIEEKKTVKEEPTGEVFSLSDSDDDSLDRLVEEVDEVLAEEAEVSFIQQSSNHVQKAEEAKRLQEIRIREMEELEQLARQQLNKVLESERERQQQAEREQADRERRQHREQEIQLQLERERLYHLEKELEQRRDRELEQQREIQNDVLDQSVLRTRGHQQDPHEFQRNQLQAERQTHLAQQRQFKGPDLSNTEDAQSLQRSWFTHDIAPRDIHQNSVNNSTRTWNDAFGTGNANLVRGGGQGSAGSSPDGNSIQLASIAGFLLAPMGSGIGGSVQLPPINMNTQNRDIKLNAWLGSKINGHSRGSSIASQLNPVDNSEAISNAAEGSPFPDNIPLNQYRRPPLNLPRRPAPRIDDVDASDDDRPLAQVPKKQPTVEYVNDGMATPPSSISPVVGNGIVSLEGSAPPNIAQIARLSDQQQRELVKIKHQDLLGDHQQSTHRLKQYEQQQNTNHQRQKQNLTGPHRQGGGPDHRIQNDTLSLHGKQQLHSIERQKEQLLNNQQEEVKQLQLQYAQQQQLQQAQLQHQQHAQNTARPISPERLKHIEYYRAQDPSKLLSRRAVVETNLAVINHKLKNIVSYQAKKRSQLKEVHEFKLQDLMVQLHSRFNTAASAGGITQEMKDGILKERNANLSIFSQEERQLVNDQKTEVESLRTSSKKYEGQFEVLNLVLRDISVPPSNVRSVSTPLMQTPPQLGPRSASHEGFEKPPQPQISQLNRLAIRDLIEAGDRRNVNSSSQSTLSHLQESKSKVTSTQPTNESVADHTSVANRVANSDILMNGITTLSGVATLEPSQQLENAAESNGRLESFQEVRKSSAIVDTGRKNDVPLATIVVPAQEQPSIGGTGKPTELEFAKVQNLTPAVKLLEASIIPPASIEQTPNQDIEPLRKKQKRVEGLLGIQLDENILRGGEFSGISSSRNTGTPESEPTSKEVSEQTGNVNARSEASIPSMFTEIQTPGDSSLSRQSKFVLVSNTQVIDLTSDED